MTLSATHHVPPKKVLSRALSGIGTIAGMRPGEIFGLRRGGLDGSSASIRERVYRRTVDAPKTHKSVRLAALSSGLIRDMEQWLRGSPDTAPDGWLFPSSTLKPISKDSAGWLSAWREWRRRFARHLNPRSLSRHQRAASAGCRTHVRRSCAARAELELRPGPSGGILLFQVVEATAELLIRRHRIDVSDNLQARAIHTQVMVLKKVAIAVIGIFTLASMRMGFESARQFAASILASAGIAGIIVDFAAQRSIARCPPVFKLQLT